jgi:hypothetical protein
MWSMEIMSHFKRTIKLNLWVVIVTQFILLELLVSYSNSLGTEDIVIRRMESVLGISLSLIGLLNSVVLIQFI